MADIQTFQGIDEPKWERVKALITKETGIEIATDSGDAKKSGIELSWIYDPITSVLSVTLVKRAFYDPSEATIEGDISKLVAQA